MSHRSTVVIEVLGCVFLGCHCVDAAGNRLVAQIDVVRNQNGFPCLAYHLQTAVEYFIVSVHNVHEMNAIFSGLLT